MPKNYRRSNPKAYRRQMPRGRNFQSAGKAAAAARRAVAKQLRMVRPETKYFDTAIEGHSIATGADWSGTEVPCDVYVQSDGTTVGAYTDSALIPSATGTGYGQIVANKYMLKKIRIRGHVQASVATAAATASAARSYRIVLIMDTAPNGSQMQGEDIFTDLGGADPCNYSFRQMGQVNQRFRILRDKVIHSQATAAANDTTATTVSTAFERVPFDIVYTFKKPIEVHVLNGSTPATSQLSNCNIFLLAHGNGTGVITVASRAYYVG